MKANSFLSKLRHRLKNTNNIKSDHVYLRILKLITVALVNWFPIIFVLQPYELRLVPKTRIHLMCFYYTLREAMGSNEKFKMLFTGD